MVTFRRLARSSTFGQNLLDTRRVFRHLLLDTKSTNYYQKYESVLFRPNQAGGGASSGGAQGKSGSSASTSGSAPSRGGTGGASSGNNQEAKDTSAAGSNKAAKNIATRSTFSSTRLPNWKEAVYNDLTAFSEEELAWRLSRAQSRMLLKGPYNFVTAEAGTGGGRTHSAVAWSAIHTKSPWLQQEQYALDIMLFSPILVHQETGSLADLESSMMDVTVGVPYLNYAGGAGGPPEDARTEIENRLNSDIAEVEPVKTYVHYYHVAGGGGKAKGKIGRVMDNAIQGAPMGNKDGSEVFAMGPHDTNLFDSSCSRPMLDRAVNKVIEYFETNAVDRFGTPRNSGGGSSSFHSDYAGSSISSGGGSASASGTSSGTTSSGATAGASIRVSHQLQLSLILENYERFGVVWLENDLYLKLLYQLLLSDPYGFLSQLEMDGGVRFLRFMENHLDRSLLQQLKPLKRLFDLQKNEGQKLNPADYKNSITQVSVSVQHQGGEQADGGSSTSEHGTGAGGQDDASKSTKSTGGLRPSGRSSSGQSSGVSSLNIGMEVQKYKFLFRLLLNVVEFLERAVTEDYYANRYAVVDGLVFHEHDQPHPGKGGAGGGGSADRRPRHLERMSANNLISARFFLDRDQYAAKMAQMQLLRRQLRELLDETHDLLLGWIRDAIVFMTNDGQEEEDVGGKNGGDAVSSAAVEAGAASSSSSSNKAQTGAAPNKPISTVATQKQESASDSTPSTFSGELEQGDSSAARARVEEIETSFFYQIGSLSAHLLAYYRNNLFTETDAEELQHSYDLAFQPLRNGSPMPWIVPAYLHEMKAPQPDHGVLTRGEATVAPKNQNDSIFDRAEDSDEKPKYADFYQHAKHIKSAFEKAVHKITKPIQHAVTLSAVYHKFGKETPLSDKEDVDKYAIPDQLLEKDVEDARTHIQRLVRRWSSCTSTMSNKGEFYKTPNIFTEMIDKDKKVEPNNYKEPSSVLDRVLNAGLEQGLANALHFCISQGYMNDRKMKYPIVSAQHIVASEVERWFFANSHHHPLGGAAHLEDFLPRWTSLSQHIEASTFSRASRVQRLHGTFKVQSAAPGASPDVNFWIINPRSGEIFDYLGEEPPTRMVTPRAWEADLRFVKIFGRDRTRIPLRMIDPEPEKNHPAYLIPRQAEFSNYAFPVLGKRTEAMKRLPRVYWRPPGSEDDPSEFYELFAIEAEEFWDWLVEDIYSDAMGLSAQLVSQYPIFLQKKTDYERGYDVWVRSGAVATSHSQRGGQPDGGGSVFDPQNAAVRFALTQNHRKSVAPDNEKSNSGPKRPDHPLFVFAMDEQGRIYPDEEPSEFGGFPNTKESWRLVRKDADDGNDEMSKNESLLHFTRQLQIPSKFFLMWDSSRNDRNAPELHKHLFQLPLRQSSIRLVNTDYEFLGRKLSHDEKSGKEVGRADKATRDEIRKDYETAATTDLSRDTVMRGEGSLIGALRKDLYRPWLTFERTGGEVAHWNLVARSSDYSLVLPMRGDNQGIHVVPGRPSMCHVITLQERKLVEIVENNSASTTTASTMSSASQLQLMPAGASQHQTKIQQEPNDQQQEDPEKKYKSPRDQGKKLLVLRLPVHTFELDHDLLNQNLEKEDKSDEPEQEQQINDQSTSTAGQSSNIAGQGQHHGQHFYTSAFRRYRLPNKLYKENTLSMTSQTPLYSIYWPNETELTYVQADLTRETNFDFDFEYAEPQQENESNTAFVSRVTRDNTKVAPQADVRGIVTDQKLPHESKLIMVYFGIAHDETNPRQVAALLDELRPMEFFTLNDIVIFEWIFAHDLNKKDHSQTEMHRYYG